MDDYKKIVSLSNEALENVNKREEHLKLENESIEKSESEFEEAKKSAETIKDRHIKKKAETAADHMEKDMQHTALCLKNMKKPLNLIKNCISF